MPRGGKREGAGRPKGSPNKTNNIEKLKLKKRSLYLTDPEHKAFLAKGGAKWLRPLLRGEITESP